MLTEGQAFDVLENEVRRPQFGHDAHEIAHETIARIVQRPLAYHREALAGSTAEHHVDSAPAQSRSRTDLGARQFGNRLRKDRAIRKIELVDRTMDGIDFDGSNDVESSLLEAETKPTHPCKQVDSYWPHHELSVSPIQDYA